MPTNPMLEAQKGQILQNLEARLQQLGFEVGVQGRLHERSRLQRKLTTMPDQHWEKHEVFEENLRDLLQWAVDTLARQGVHRRAAQDKPTHSRFAPTQGALSYMIASDGAVQEQVKAIRQTFWQRHTPPFPTHNIGQIDALRQAQAWIEHLCEEDAEARLHRTTHVALTAVFEYEHHRDQTPDLSDLLRETLLGWSVPQADGTYLGREVSGKELLEKITSVVPLDGVMVTHRSVRGCDSDGGDSPMVGLRGPDGWMRYWKIAYGTRVYSLWKNCQELAKLTKKWKVAEALEYVLTGIVPTLGPQTSWSDLGNPNADVTITLRGPTTKDDLLRAYTGITQNAHFLKPNVRKLSQQLLAVLQVYHDLPEATWRQRIEKFNMWANHHQELKPYIGAAAQQSIRKDYVRALERSKWQYRSLKAKSETEL